MIQTHHPEHYAIRAALTADDAAFAEQEMHFRRVFHYPPFTRMTQILVRGGNRSTVEREARELARRLEEALTGTDVRLNGPAPAAFERLRGKWRFQILLRGQDPRVVRGAVRAALPERSTSEIIVDVDPYQLL